MKLSVYILVGSLIANGVLLILVALRGHNESNATNLSSAHVPLIQGTTLGETPPPLATRTSTSGSLWSRIHATDIEKLMTNLRAAGFPDDVIREIAFREYFRKRQSEREAITGRRADIPYWKNTYTPPTSPEQRQKIAQFERDETKEFRRLFPTVEDFSNPDFVDHTRRRFGEISDEKVRRLMKIESDFSELEMDIFFSNSATGKGLSTADREKLTLLQKEQERDIQQSLTPAEYQQYLLRSSGTASRLRMQLQLFQATEAEYQTLFALHRPIDEKFASWSDDKTVREAYEAEINRLKPQIETVLGPDRYADYIQATEHGSDKLNRLMARLDLPLSTAGKVTDVRQDISERAEVIRNDQTLEPADRSNRLAALAQEAKTKLTSTLGGDRGYQAYDDLKGDWIRALQPKSP